MLFPRKAIQYLFFEMLPSFIIGILVFLAIMIMFQAIHYTEFVLIHGVSIWIVIKMLSFICISFLPALLPMALLFSVLMTYGRLSQDSEIIALKASGYNMWWILSPAIILGIFVSLFSAQTSFHLAPWGNRQFEILISRLEQTKASATIREGTFSDGFFDLVLYANKVNTNNDTIEKVFIYDEKEDGTPLTVIAKNGKIVQEASLEGRSVFLRLFNGDIHRQNVSHTKIKFNNFDIRLFDPAKENLRDKSAASLSIEEISEKLTTNLKNDLRNDLEVEYHKRWAVSIVCIIFSLLGVGLGTNVNTRHQKNNGLIISLIVVIGYWLIYVSAEGLARTGKITPGLALWFPNSFFLIFSVIRLKQVWD